MTSNREYHYAPSIPFVQFAKRALELAQRGGLWCNRFFENAAEFGNGDWRGHRDTSLCSNCLFCNSYR